MAMLSVSMPITRRRIVVFSGGSAANSLVPTFEHVIDRNFCSISYVIPISDNGGSSSELIRVFGGPGIGDVRSRLVRLIPSSHAAIHNLFNHRLPSSPETAATEFMSILLGTSPLYDAIGTAQTMFIRSILSHFYSEILKRSRPPSSTFNYQSASIGNLFLTGARLFSGSFESAIYLLAIIGGIDESRVNTLPAIISNHSHHISAGLANGDVIVGQNAISHPSEPTALTHEFEAAGAMTSSFAAKQHGSVIEDANLPGSHPSLSRQNISFSKLSEAALPARIDRIWYINPYGQEMQPTANPRVLEALGQADAIIYSIGSLYTSIVPSLILQGVGAAIADPGGPRFKIFILNGSLDRETGGFNACDFLDAIVKACDQHRNPPSSATSPIDRQRWHNYITHVVYLEGRGAPEVDREVLVRHGIECIRLYGRNDGILKYDQAALMQALTTILGTRERSEKSRRNSLLG